MLSRNNLILSLLFVVIGTMSAHAQTLTNTAEATATATIISPLTLTKETDMNFGSIAVGPTSGTVMLPPTALPMRIHSGGVTLIPLAIDGTITAAKFRVTGAPLHTYAITLPPSVTLKLTADASSETMIARDFTTNQANNSGIITAGVLNEFYVGATLEVKGNQAAGVYVSSPFEVTVNYN